MQRQLYAGFDVEGILVLPKADFAWLVYDNLLSDEVKTLFPRNRCEDYDGSYDDGRYLHELANPEGHSTGTWPCVSAALAAMSGVSDYQLFEYAKKTTQEMPGTKELLEHAAKITDGRVYFFTSSYPAVALHIAHKYGIPSSHIFAMGRQHAGLGREYTDAKQKINIAAETEMRSPVKTFLKHPVALAIFMAKYFDITETMGRCYGSGVVDTDAYRALLYAHDSLFASIPDELKDLRTELENCFLSPTSMGNMGSRNKTAAMRSVHDNGGDWAYFGDGIVDGDPIGYACYGASMNMRDKHALPKSKVSIVTTDNSNLIPVLDQAFEGEFDVEELKATLKNAKVFSPHDIRTNIEAVRTAVGAAKNRLNELYVQV